ncbi:hypothetical protein CONCODRAFT_12607 [Conidiobolus coronatus NRRL 28638]|uniref:Uncharacterized protein n=1 Tax=Conidiobolus coronatus (strain ATCC 28846 / CBS 209.66 / NRRL 28638) TaxID=796925 RepID=A0A137NSH1_CONC2|nr:hypothetical protein CONCODRAFT_12607 [Conidiobolus coronatus NRRL 28638]|eukprot:KXN65719.1 hypothetical protein CONCODRAFT_12607 [Conidiobolus coronatus NRRL 28638]
MLINLNHSKLLFNLGIEPYGVRHNLLHEIKKLTSNNIKTTMCKKSPNKFNNIEDFSFDKDNKGFINNNIGISNSSDTVANAIQKGNIKVNGIASNTKMNEVKENGSEISYLHELDPIKW